ncbi:MAG TPA: hypothetical protein VD995_01140 [Azospirillum sp.]|nr:hypothetical protein [Azospirillum sp.]
MMEMDYFPIMGRQGTQECTFQTRRRELEQLAPTPDADMPDSTEERNRGPSSSHAALNPIAWQFKRHLNIIV